MPTAVQALIEQRQPRDLTRSNPAVADVTVDRLVLDGRPMDAVVSDPVECGLERRLDGASNLTPSLLDPAVGDPPRPKLLNSGIFSKAVDLDLDVPGLDGVKRAVDRLAFRLADRAVTDIGGTIGLDLTFEATAVARLRTFFGARHASRNDKTRAEFIKALCDEAGVPFVCPGIHKKQRIQTVEEAMTPAQRKAERTRAANRSGKGGAAKGKTSEITIKGKKASPEQLKNIETASRAADAESASALAETAMHCAAIGESSYRSMMNSGGSPYGGVWQGNVRDGTWKLSDVAGMARAFLRGGKGFQGGGAIALATAHPDWTPGRIALTVEGSLSNFGGSVTKGAAFYDAYRSEATTIMQAFGASGSLDPLANTTSEPEPYAIAYMFKRLGADETSDGKPEDSWTCIRRLADEVNWRLWEDRGTIYFMTDDRILRSSVEMTVEPMQDGVYSVSARESNRRDLQEITIECDARLWQAGPATVVEMYGWGDPMDGRWILSSIRRPSLWSPRTTITVQRRQKALLEAAHEVGQRSASDEAGIRGTSADLIGSNGVSLTAGGLPSPLSLRGRIVAIATASQSTKTGFNRYSQAGALTSNPTPAAPARTDCSQWIRACYLTAGGPDPGANTFQMSNLGTITNKPQIGDIMLTANRGHCEIYVGNGQTIGHGSPKIDGANVRDFPGHFFVTYDALDGPGKVAIGYSPTTGFLGGIR